MSTTSNPIALPMPIQAVPPPTRRAVHPYKGLLVRCLLVVAMLVTIVVPAAAASAQTDDSTTVGTIYAIKHAGLSSTEVHMIDGDSMDAFTLQTPTPVRKATARHFDSEIGDYNGDGVEDLYLIKYRGAGATEVHVLDGAARFDQFLFQGKLALHVTNVAHFDFELGDYNNDGQLDLYVIKARGRNKTEVHILDGAQDFTRWLLHRETPIGRTSLAQWDFEVGRYDDDDIDDLYAIKAATRGRTALHILGGASGFTEFVANSTTALNKTTRSKFDFEVSDFDGDNVDDVYAIKYQGVDTTEVHVLSGANPKRWLRHSKTPIAPTNNIDWGFAIGRPSTAAQAPAPAPTAVPEPVAPQPKSKLTTGESMRPGDRLSSPTGDCTLRFQDDRNLVAYNEDGPAWAAWTMNSGATLLVMQRDGNLVMYNQNTEGPRKDVWSTGTYNHPGAHAALQDDCSLTVRDENDVVLWNSAAPPAPAPAPVTVPAPEPAATTDNVMSRGETLERGDQLWSDDDSCYLEFHDNQNLALYAEDKPNGRWVRLWSSGTTNSGATSVVVQDDGNFVMYNYALAEPAVWATNTHQNPGAYIRVENDCAIAVIAANTIVTALWKRPTPPPPAAAPAAGPGVPAPRPTTPAPAEVDCSKWTGPTPAQRLERYANVSISGGGAAGWEIYRGPSTRAACGLGHQAHAGDIATKIAEANGLVYINYVNNDGADDHGWIAADAIGPATQSTGAGPTDSGSTPEQAAPLTCVRVDGCSTAPSETEDLPVYGPPAPPQCSKANVVDSVVNWYRLGGLNGSHYPGIVDLLPDSWKDHPAVAISGLQYEERETYFRQETTCDGEVVSRGDNHKAIEFRARRCTVVYISGGDRTMPSGVFCGNNSPWHYLPPVLEY